MRARAQRFKAALTDLALNANLIKGHTDYTKFIILGMGRVGSNFLASSLRSHNNVVAFGEISNNKNTDRILWEYPGYRATANQLSLREREPRKFIDSLVFKKMPADILAVGFKLFYYHAQEPHWQCVWPHLRDRQVVAIHLKRKNLLRLQLSMTIALQTRQWSASAKHKTHKQTAIPLNYDDCIEGFEAVRNWHAQFDSYFDRNLEVFYEDLVSNYDAQIGVVQDFLGVPRRITTASTVKQAQLPLSAAISNYSELKKKFSNTEWALYFEE